MPSSTEPIQTSPPPRRIARHTAWKIALIAGFVTQLLLIVFVTVIGLQRLELTTRNLNRVVDVHMRKQGLIKEGHANARFWMSVLSAAALLVGLLVASVVLYFATRISRERERLATHDTLTGLPNRMMFMDRLEQALIRAQRHDTLVGIMFIDLDRFKRVNDTLGHASGDLLIRAVAERLRSAVRADDTVARLGGDEFVVVINDVNTLNPILLVVEKVLGAISAPYNLDGRELFSSCSIGVSVYPNDGRTSGDLLKFADTAMYHAKNAGRNRFQLYDATMNAMAEERLQLETDLHYAKARGELVFHYQP
jgi:diguanylate cyclase (GGDEF)-like protein